MAVDRMLTYLAWGWVSLQLMLNLASIALVGDDAGSNYGPGMLSSGIGLLSSPHAMLVHTGYLLGNLIFALPAVGAFYWRDRLRARRSVMPLG
jgi:hypothetical protein